MKMFDRDHSDDLEDSELDDQPSMSIRPDIEMISDNDINFRYHVCSS